MHIIRNLGKYGITSDKLKEVAYDAKRQIKPPERMEILDEIFRVRKLEERLERQEVGTYMGTLAFYFLVAFGLELNYFAPVLTGVKIQ